MTKNKSKPIALLGIAMLFTVGLRAQSIFFNYIDGTNASYNLEDVRKITFDEDVMNLHLLDGSTYSWNVSTIGYYEYDQTPLNVEQLVDHANTWQAVVFPNPVNNSLQIRYHLPKADVVKIALYDMQGKLIVENNIGNQKEGQHQAMLDLSHINAGNYMCRITGQKASISKQIIKQ
jgi:hypothetical protein